MKRILKQRVQSGSYELEKQIWNETIEKKYKKDNHENKIKSLPAEIGRGGEPQPKDQRRLPLGANAAQNLTSLRLKGFVREVFRKVLLQTFPKKNVYI